MTHTEIAELINSVNVYELAHKTTSHMDLTDAEKDAASQLDAHFKEIGKRGVDANKEIAAFIQKVINEEIYNTPDELLSEMFDEGDIGEFDDYEAWRQPKNTLIAYDAAKGGNVERSFLDITVLEPTWRNFQIETDISYADVEKNGWKTVALYTDDATAAFKNKLFKVVFDLIDAAIQSGAPNYIKESGTTVSQATMDAAALYVQDIAGYGAGTFVARSKYIQQASKLTGFTSPEIINEVHRTGKAGVYDGVGLTPISSAKKLGDGSNLIIDKRIFGIAGKIGTLNMKGEIKVYEDSDNNKEKFHLLFKGFTVGIAFNKDTLENIVKVEVA